MKKLAFIFLLAIIVGLPCPAQAQSPQQTLNQFVADLQKNPSDYALREKIIRHVQAMKPAPAVPFEAEKFEGRAEFAIKNAKTEADFLDAAKEYEKALLVAPWVPAYYFNQGIAFEKAGKLKEAKRSFEFYLLAAPRAQDAREVRKRIAGLEYAMEKAAKESSPRATAEKKQMTDEELIKKINGARYTRSYRDETYGTGGEGTIDVRGNVAIYGLIITWTRDGKPIEGFPFGVWRQTGRDGFVRGRQIIIPEQSWAWRNGSWFPHEPMICAIGENGSTLTCNQTIQTGSQLTTTYRQQR
jgi:hypothetical protein